LISDNQVLKGDYFMKTKSRVYLAVMMVLLSAVTAWAGSEGPPNVYYGSGAGASNTTGFADTFIGLDAGNQNTTGYRNSFLGLQAGEVNTIGNDNTFIGSDAGSYNTTGNSNSFLGSSAGIHNTTGSNNSFIGSFAGDNNTTGNSNSFLGSYAGILNTTGSNNVFLGVNSGFNNTTGNSNSFLGLQAGYSNTTGSNNAFLGFDAGASNITGYNNVFLGYRAGNTETGSNKLYIDNCYTAGDCDQPLIYGEFNNRIVDIDGTLTATAFVGDGSGLTGITISETDPKVGTLTTGKWCTSNGTTVSCTADNPGYQGTADTFFGLNAGINTSGANSDTFVGANAGSANTTGNYNSFIGHSAGAANTTGYGNSFIGNDAGYQNTTGGANTYIGSGAGASNITGYNNVFLGYSAGNTETGSNKLFIDNCVTGYPCTQPLIYGEFDNRIVKINGTLFMTSDERLKKNIEPLKTSLDKVMHLQGVSYEWKADKNRGNGFTKDREIGLIAQNVEAIIPELVHTDSQGYKAVAYDKMIPVLIEAVKEQQKEIKEQATTIAEQKTVIADLRAKIEKALELMEKRLALLEGPALTIASNQ
jgi:hypothetical protein